MRQKIRAGSPVSTGRGRILSVWDHFKGHFFFFGHKPEGHSPSAGLRLLLLFIVFEYLIGPRMHAASWAGLEAPGEEIRVISMLIALLLAVRIVAGPFSIIGMRPWSNWNTAEKSYFVQTFILANVVFSVLYFDRLSAVFANPALWGAIGVSLLIHVLWGFYQEAIYRGVLQSELSRRFGAIAGILVANIAFTFGPLHFYHLFETENPIAMFGAIFAIGLLFGVLFQRSRNLWIVGVLHGIGDFYIGGLQQG